MISEEELLTRVAIAPVILSTKKNYVRVIFYGKNRHPLFQFPKTMWIRSVNTS